MHLGDFDYYLPDNLIAQKPVSPRDSARLLIMEKSSGRLQDDYFFNLDKLLRAGDVLVMNKTKVIPARIIFKLGEKSAEILLVKKTEEGYWKAMIRPGKYFKVGQVIKIDAQEVKVLAIDQDGLRVLDFNLNDQEMQNFINFKGKLPVPPYIKGSDYQESEYNTVYCENGESIAAPTAGLHFTKDLIGRLLKKGILIEYVNLEVGLGTFLPVKVPNIEDHKMHWEKYEIDTATANKLNKYLEEKRRIIAVGTTSVRVLEDNINRFKKITAGSFETNIFIKPGYDWQVIDGLITNFHLPKSTLLMLVCALAGRENIFKAYQQAINNHYRFYSFGDAMLII